MIWRKKKTVVALPAPPPPDGDGKKELEKEQFKAARKRVALDILKTQVELTMREFPHGHPNVH